MSRLPSPTATRVYRGLLVIGAPLLFFLLLEAGVRIAGIDAELVRNAGFRIAVPVWLLEDGNWVDTQLGRIGNRQVNASDVAWLQYFEEARHIQYKLRPDINVRALNPFNADELRMGKTFGIESNAQGFRTKPFTPKPARRRRIIAVGDSSTFGWGVEPEYTYEALLETRLTDRQIPSEVVNLGIPGFTSRHGTAVVDHYALSLDPDLLIFSFGANDKRPVRIPAAEVLARDDAWQGAVRATLRRFEVFKLLRKLIFLVYDPLADVRGGGDGQGDEPPLVPSVSREQFGENLRQMIARGRAAGAQSILLAVCAPEDYARMIRFVADEEHVPFVDALTLFQSSGDPRSPRMQSIMNLKIKYREGFRPFAPSVQREYVADWFELDTDSPYMLLVAGVHADRRRRMTDEESRLWGIDKLNVPRSDVPAITHVDYSARIQTVRRDVAPLYWDILEAFRQRTGCPVIVNTSFNVRGEPIVCTPEDAYRCFMRTEMDALVLEDCLLDKAAQPPFEEASDWRQTFALD